MNVGNVAIVDDVVKLGLVLKPDHSQPFKRLHHEVEVCMKQGLFSFSWRFLFESP